MKQLRLITTQAVELRVPPQSFPIEEYLRSPDRLMRTLAPEENLQLVGTDRYRLTIAPISVLSLTITPIVDMNVWLDSAQKVQIESVAFKMRGLEGFHDRFDFKLLGELYPVHTPKEVLLRGSALLRIDLSLPRPFSVMPQSIVEGAGNAVLNATLGAVKGRMLQNLVRDYEQWSLDRSSSMAR